MAKDSTGLILLAGGAAVAYYGYTQGWFASWGLSPAAATPAPAPTPTMPAAASTSAALPSATTMPATAATPAGSSYSGPSLAAMLAALTAKVQASIGSDSDLICPASSNSAVSQATANLQAAQTALAQAQASMIPANVQSAMQDVVTATQALAAAAGSASASTCAVSSVVATYDVWNWFLVNAGVGVKDGQLQAPDHTSQISLAQYWAWAAPQLQSQIPGLSGLGHVYAGLGELVRRVKGGW